MKYFCESYFYKQNIKNLKVTVFMFMYMVRTGQCLFTPIIYFLELFLIQLMHTCVIVMRYENTS